MPNESGPALAELCGGPADGLLLETAGATRLIFVPRSPASAWLWDEQNLGVHQQAPKPWRCYKTRDPDPDERELFQVLHYLGARAAARYVRSPGLTERSALRFIFAGVMRTT